MKRIECDDLVLYLEEQVENTCEYISMDCMTWGEFTVRIKVLPELSTPEKLEQFEYNLRLIADKVKEFRDDTTRATND